MEFSFTKNPNELPCPVCGEDCVFDIQSKVITSSNCKRKLIVNSNSKKLKAAGYSFIIISVVLANFFKLNTSVLVIVGILCLLIGLIFIGYSNGEAKLVKAESNT